MGDIQRVAERAVHADHQGDAAAAAADYRVAAELITARLEETLHPQTRAAYEKARRNYMLRATALQQPATAASTDEPGLGRVASPDPDDVQTVMAVTQKPEQDCIEALKKYDSNIDRAVNSLLDAGTSGPSSPAAPPAAPAASAAAAPAPAPAAAAPPLPPRPIGGGDASAPAPAPASVTPPIASERGSRLAPSATPAPSAPPLAAGTQQERQGLGLGGLLAWPWRGRASEHVDDPPPRGASSSPASGTFSLGKAEGHAQVRSSGTLESAEVEKGTGTPTGSPGAPVPWHAPVPGASPSSKDTESEDPATRPEPAVPRVVSPPSEPLTPPVSPEEHPSSPRSPAPQSLWQPDEAQAAGLTTSKRLTLVLEAARVDPTRLCNCRLFVPECKTPVALIETSDGILVPGAACWRCYYLSAMSDIPVDDAAGPELVEVPPGGPLGEDDFLWDALATSLVSDTVVCGSSEFTPDRTRCSRPASLARVEGRDAMVPGLCWMCKCMEAKYTRFD
mmetsp:Transcript_6093/g.17799  ORF Transcript_6093/g.17799 Transcript_6093/m.17799 type:complete len:507 (-) Transcript_6093:225-1745(-)